MQRVVGNNNNDDKDLEHRRIAESAGLSTSRATKQNDETSIAVTDSSLFVAKNRKAKHFSNLAAWRVIRATKHSEETQERRVSKQVIQHRCHNQALFLTAKLSKTKLSGEAPHKVGTKEQDRSNRNAHQPKDDAKRKSRTHSRSSD